MKGEVVRKPSAAVGSAVFFVLAPGTAVGLVPWWITDWEIPSLCLLGASAGGGRFPHRRGLGRADPTRSHDSSWKASELLRPSRRPSIWSSAASTGTSAIRCTWQFSRSSSVKPWPSASRYCWPTPCPAVDRRRLVRPLLRGAGAKPPLRRPVRGLPTCRASLVAPPASVENRRARQPGRTMTSPRVEAGKAQLTAGVRPHDLGASPGQSLAAFLSVSLKEAVCHGSPLCCRSSLRLPQPGAVHCHSLSSDGLAKQR